MKLYNILFIFIFINVGCQNNNAGNRHIVNVNINDGCQPNNDKIKYIGAWYWKNMDSSSSFKIILSKRNDSIYGQYCAAYNFGNRLDCDFDTIYNLKGKISKDSILLTFHSFYGAKNGEAIIKLNKDVLSWYIKKWPTGGDCFAPEKAEMCRSIKGWK